MTSSQQNRFCPPAGGDSAAVLRDLTDGETRQVQGAGWRREVGLALCATSALVCGLAHVVHEATKD